MGYAFAICIHKSLVFFFAKFRTVKDMSSSFAEFKAMPMRKSMVREIMLDFKPQRPALSQHNRRKPEPNRLPTCSTASKRHRVSHRLNAEEGVSSTTQQHSARPLPTLDFRYTSVCQAIQQLLDADAAAPPLLHDADDEPAEAQQHAEDERHDEIVISSDVAPFTMRAAIKVANLFAVKPPPLGDAYKNNNRTTAAVTGEKLKDELESDEVRFQNMLARVEARLATADPDGERLLSSHQHLDSDKRPVDAIQPRNSRTTQPLQQVGASRQDLGMISRGGHDDTQTRLLLGDTSLVPSSVLVARDGSNSIGAAEEAPLPLLHSSRSLMGSRGDISHRPSHPFTLPKSVPMTPRLGHREEERKKLVVNIMQSFVDNV